MDETQIPLFWLLFVSVGIITLARDVFIRNMQQNKEEKKALEEKLNNEMQMLVAAHLQLSNYLTRELLVTAFSRFVTKEAYVHAAQLYKYHVHHHRGLTTIRVNYIDGYVTEHIDLNAIQQVYYSFSIEMYREFNKAREELLTRGHYHKIIQFIQTYNHQLSVKAELDDNDAMIYAFVLAGIELLEQEFGFQPIAETYLDSGKIKWINGRKRTGLLRAILLNHSFYSFTHTRENEKFNRQYVVSHTMIRGETYVFILVMDADILEEEGVDEIFSRITADFEKVLQKVFNSMYTKGNPINERIDRL